MDEPYTHADYMDDLLPGLADGIRRVAADHSLGGAVNALDDLAKTYGDAFPAVVRDAGVALARMLDAVHLGTGADPMAADVWRATT